MPNDNPVYVQFECGQEDRVSPVFGPFRYIQQTYTSLRIDEEPDGSTDELARFAAHVDGIDTQDGFWHILRPGMEDEQWSDFIVHTDPKGFLAPDDKYLTPEGLEMTYGWWGCHPQHTVNEWRAEVDAHETRKGYWQWVSIVVTGEKESS